MSTTIARVAFANLAVSAKLHRLLDAAGERQNARSASDLLAFDAQVTDTLHTLDAQAGKATAATPFGDVDRHRELLSIKRDLDAIERLYLDYARKESLPETVAERFERIFSELRAKVNEKEVSSTHS